MLRNLSPMALRPIIIPKELASWPVSDKATAVAIVQAMKQDERRTPAAITHDRRDQIANEASVSRATIDSLIEHYSRVFHFYFLDFSIYWYLRCFIASNRWSARVLGMVLRWSSPPTRIWPSGDLNVLRRIIAAMRPEERMDPSAVTTERMHEIARDAPTNFEIVAQTLEHCRDLRSYCEYVYGLSPTRRLIMQCRIYRSVPQTSNKDRK